MEKKEHYRHLLPHYQQPGQAYFVTWCLKDAVLPKALATYTNRLKTIQSQIDSIKGNEETEKKKALKAEYYQTRKKYLKTYNDLLDLPSRHVIDLSRAKNTQTLVETLTYWHAKRLENYAFCVMPNHIHWVFRLFEVDENKNPVYLQDILQSVKRFSANRINKNETRKGTVWQKENFDTTIRDERHLYNAVRYTVENPVKAGLIRQKREWNGTFLAEGMWDL